MPLDMHTGQIEQLLDEPFPTEFVGTGGYAWNPEMTRGISGEGRGRYISEELYWFTSNSWERVDLDFAQSYGPSWSPDGETIAFVAADKEGSPRTYSTYDIYAMDKQGNKVQRVVKGIQHIGGTAWSPDGRWLAFPGKVTGFEHQEGLWLLDFHSQNLIYIAQGDFDPPSWSPDGSRLVTIHNEFTDAFPEEGSAGIITEIVILELEEILAELGG